MDTLILGNLDRPIIFMETGEPVETQGADGKTKALTFGEAFKRAAATPGPVDAQGRPKETYQETLDAGALYGDLRIALRDDKTHVEIVKNDIECLRKRLHAIFPPQTLFQLEEELKIAETMTAKKFQKEKLSIVGEEATESEDG